MTTIRTLTFTVVLGAMLSSTTSMAQETPAQASPKPAKPAPTSESAPKESKPLTATVGKAAPDFTLKDIKGTSHQLSDYAGKFVVIEWFNPGCPYCRNVYSNGVVADTISQMKKIDPEFVYLAINSTANQPKEFVMTQSDEFLEKQTMCQIPVLMDYDGKVGKLYKARTTPHMYVIDPNGVLIYAGAFTNDSGFDKGNKAINYVVNAANQSSSEEAVSPRTVNPWGCGVKYADGGSRRGKGRGGRRP